MATLDRRLRMAKSVAAGARFITVMSPESELGTNTTVDLAIWLRKRFGPARLVWLMGSDNLGEFHRWKDWRHLAALLPIAVIDRPGTRHAVLSAQAARVLERFRWPEAAAKRLADAEPPAWVVLHGPLNDQSSTAIRAADNW